MQVRLAFATAIQKEPDILLVDEVLAVGDMDFQQKCLDVFADYKKKGITMLFVSHDLNSVRKFCDKTLLLRNGEAVLFNETNKVIDQYVYASKSMESAVPQYKEVEPPEVENAQTTVNTESSDAENENRPQQPVGNKKVLITSLEFIDKYGNVNANFMFGDPLTIRIRYEVREDIEDLGFGIIFYNDAGIYCYGTTTSFKHIDPDRSVGKKILDLVIERVPMLEGRYYITIAAAMHYVIVYDWLEKKYSFVVHKDSQDLGLFEIPCEWIVRDNE
jgi:lipopolysaccharide transport system ATP-binding protein